MRRRPTTRSTDEHDAAPSTASTSSGRTNAGSEVVEQLRQPASVPRRVQVTCCKRSSSPWPTSVEQRHRARSRAPARWPPAAPASASRARSDRGTCARSRHAARSSVPSCMRCSAHRWYAAVMMTPVAASDGDDAVAREGADEHQHLADEAGEAGQPERRHEGEAEERGVERHLRWRARRTCRSRGCARGRRRTPTRMKSIAVMVPWLNICTHARLNARSA